jgi:hypothetical protein
VPAAARSRNSANHPLEPMYFTPHIARKGTLLKKYRWLTPASVRRSKMVGRLLNVTLSSRRSVWAAH